MPIRLPTENDRLVIIGRTGGGKTIAGLWQLSLQPVDEFTWIIFDWKRDENIARIPYTIPWSFDQGIPPSGGGLYVVRPSVEDDERVNDFLNGVREQENLGLYVDEGMMLKRSVAYKNIQFQGRSKRIPCITLTQLPIELPRAVFTEATFVQVFYVLDSRYRKVIAEFTPITDEEIENLRRFHSLYYDVVENRVQLLRPVPRIEETLSRFELMLRPPADVNDEIPALERATGYTRSPI